MIIKSVRAAQRLDSRGNPTVQVEVETELDTFRSLVPSGASTGKHEAVELRDGDKSQYGGKSVLKAVQNVNEIIGPALIEREWKLDPKTHLKDIDQVMRDIDGTPNKSRLGANAILGVSMACARAGAAAARVPLYEFLRREAGRDKGPFVMPVPFLNVLNGGVHSGNTMAFQEIMIAPVGAGSFEEAMRMAAEVYHCLKKVISDKYGAPGKLIPEAHNETKPIILSKPPVLVTRAVSHRQTPRQKRHWTSWKQRSVRVAIQTRQSNAIDPASSEFFLEGGSYDLGFKDKTQSVLSRQAMKALYTRLIEQYPIALLEDPFAEDDWESWTEFNESCPIEVVGDDLLVTNVDRVKTAENGQGEDGL